MVDTAKEAYGHLQMAVELIENDWDRNQAIDALNYLKENNIEKPTDIEEVLKLIEEMIFLAKKEAMV